MKRIFITLAAIASLTLTNAQTTKKELTANYTNASSNYIAYPSPSGKQAPAPTGYEPFYISHYGRHGARTRSDDKELKNAIAFLEKQELSELGISTLKRLRLIDSLTAGRPGELTALGYQQMREIAERMHANYPTVFGGNKKIDARSTYIPRSIASMSTFCLTLQSKTPSLNITPIVSDRDMPALNMDRVKNPVRPAAEGTAYQEYMQFFNKLHGNSERLVGSLTKSKKKQKADECARFGIDFYHVAAATQCMPELDFNLLELFTKDELWDHWQARNAFWYSFCGAYATPNIRAKEFGEPLWQDIIERAEDAIKNGNKCADIRFGHDTGLVPLIVYLGINGQMKQPTDYSQLYTTWADFKVSPMAANLQMVFYKNNEDKVLVKFLLNEEEATLPLKTDTWPYYEWEKVKRIKE